MSVDPPPKPPPTREQSVAHEIRSNVIGAIIFLTLTAIVLWSSHTSRRTEVMQDVGSTLLALGDIVFLVLITFDFIRALLPHRASVQPIPVAVSDTPTNPARLVWTNALFGLSGAGLVLTLLFAHGAGSLGGAILWSAIILGLYRTILFLVLQGIIAIRKRMRRLKQQ
jgi:hypothetical protein